MICRKPAVSSKRPPGWVWFTSTPNLSSRWRSASSSPACSGSAITGGLRWRRRPGVVFLNLFFLLTIIILPVTNGLYGVYRLDGVIAVIYGLHLTLIAVVNALLWILALRGRYDPYLMVTALFPAFVLVLATGVASVAPSAAQFIWCLAFVSPFAGW